MRNLPNDAGCSPVGWAWLASGPDGREGSDAICRVSCGRESSGRNRCGAGEHTKYTRVESNRSKIDWDYASRRSWVARFCRIGPMCDPWRPLQALDQAGGKPTDDLFAEGAAAQCHERFGEIGLPEDFSVEIQ